MLTMLIVVIVSQTCVYQHLVNCILYALYITVCQCVSIKTRENKTKRNCVCDKGLSHLLVIGCMEMEESKLISHFLVYTMSGW